MPAVTGTRRGREQENDGASAHSNMHRWRAPLLFRCGHPDPHACAGPWLIIEPLAEVVGGVAIGAQIVRFLQHDPIPW